MSDAAEVQGPNGCPITDAFLPPNLKKHVAPGSPVPLRMMAAKGLVPLGPSDFIRVLFILLYDEEASVRDAAGQTALNLPERVVGSAFRDEAIHPLVLGWYLDLFAAKDAYAEWLVANPRTPDEAVERVAGGAGARLAEHISQNQLRLLRTPGIIRQLCANAGVPVSVVDGMCEFAVRSGVTGMDDVPQMRAAWEKIFGAAAPVPTAPPEPTPSADEMLQAFQQLQQEEAAVEAEEAAAHPQPAAAAPAPASRFAPKKEKEPNPEVEGKKLTLAQRVMKMTISEKVKLATLGNKEARTILLRDTNKLVCTAAIRSPRITEGEVLAMANNRAANEEVLRIIYTNRDWCKAYALRLALIKNPRVPAAISMKMLGSLHESDLKELARSRNVPAIIQQMAKKATDKANEPKKEEK
ncbi:MAG: hypothetical protein RL653_1292 [Pseudomonadota bacterium]|jgi:hypothetical protein